MENGISIPDWFLFLCMGVTAIVIAVVGWRLLIGEEPSPWRCAVYIGAIIAGGLLIGILAGMMLWLLWPLALIAAVAVGAGFILSFAIRRFRGSSR
jgi:hypothetical protein